MYSLCCILTKTKVPLKIKEIKKEIKSFLKGESSETQKKELSAFLDSYQSDDYSWKSEYGDEDEVRNRILKNIQKKLPKEKRKPSSIVYLVKYAAAVVLILGAAFYWESQQIINNGPAPIDSDEIVLRLSDGSTKIINTAHKDDLVDTKGTIIGVQLEDKISYADTNLGDVSDELVFNELYVPFGKKFELELSDGTQVTLNSGSSLKYPVRFLDNQVREVFLTGEAFFDVTKSKTDIFKVHANEIVTEVYGTQFNIMAYENEDIQEVVLVEGSVGVSNTVDSSNQKLMLVPNQKAQLNKTTATISKKDVNVDSYIAWKYDVLNFQNLKFQDILKKMERHYNITIVNEFHGIENDPYTGTFETETPSQILSYLSHIRPFQFKVEGDVITISQYKN